MRLPRIRQILAAAAAIAMMDGAGAAQSPRNACPTLKALTGAPQQAIQFRFEGPTGIALVLQGGTQFAPNPESCDLDDTLGINCDWKFKTRDVARKFYEDMLEESRACLGLPLPDEAVPADPNDGNPWNPVRRALSGTGAFEFELIEHGLDHYVKLTIDPMEFQTVDQR